MAVERHPLKSICTGSGPLTSTLGKHQIANVSGTVPHGGRCAHGIQVQVLTVFLGRGLQKMSTPLVPEMTGWAAPRWCVECLALRFHFQRRQRNYSRMLSREGGKNQHIHVQPDARRCCPSFISRTLYTDTLTVTTGVDCTTMQHLVQCRAVGYDWGPHLSIWEMLLVNLSL